MVENNGKIDNETHTEINMPRKNNKTKRNANDFGRNLSLTIVEKKIALCNKAILRV